MQRLLSEPQQAGVSKLDIDETQSHTSLVTGCCVIRSLSDEDTGDHNIGDTIKNDATRTARKLRAKRQRVVHRTFPTHFPTRKLTYNTAQNEINATLLTFQQLTTAITFYQLFMSHLCAERNTFHTPGVHRTHTYD